MTRPVRSLRCAGSSTLRAGLAPPPARLESKQQNDTRVGDFAVALPREQWRGAWGSAWDLQSKTLYKSSLGKPRDSSRVLSGQRCRGVLESRPRSRCPAAAQGSLPGTAGASSAAERVQSPKPGEPGDWQQGSNRGGEDTQDIQVKWCSEDC